MSINKLMLTHIPYASPLMRLVAVKVGEFDRGGKTRIPTVALDHHFDATATLTPYGIFLPEFNELYLFSPVSQQV